MTAVEDGNELRLRESLGPEILMALEDPRVCEIMVNPDGRVFCERTAEGLVESGRLEECRTQSVIRTVASLTGQELRRDCPIVSCELPYDGARFEGLLPPLSRGACFCLRKHNCLNLSLKELQERGMLTPDELAYLRRALEERLSIIVAGETGCGKTTLINALIAEIAARSPQERVVCIEDTRELKVSLRNSVSLLAGRAASMSALVRSTLRLRPDRLIVGEVRGEEALDLLDALSTGHRGGLASLHAGSTAEALRRLTLLISRHPRAPRLIEPLIADAVDLVCVLRRRPRRCLASLARIEGFEGGSFSYTTYGEQS